MKRYQNSQGTRGVTLIETIMVIVVLAMAAVTSVIFFDGDWVARRGATSATNDVANSLIIARNTAITNQADVAVRRMRTSGRQHLLITEYAGPFRGSKSWIVDLGQDVRIRGVPRTIRFSATGTADRSLNWTITQSGLSGTVRVAPASGQIQRQLP